MKSDEIFEAAKSGKIKLLKELLNRFPVSHRFICREKGWSPLHHAANASKLKSCQVLLDAGAEPNKLTRANRFSPMDVADGTRRKQIIKLLKSNGGKFNKPTLFSTGGNWSDCDLHRAVEEGDQDRIDELLEDESTAINARDERGWMAIHYAVDYEELDIVKALVEHGANVNGGTLADGLNPMEIAKDNGNAEIQAYLKSKGGRLNIYRGQQTHRKTEKWVKPAKERKLEYDPNAMFPKQPPKKGLLSKLGAKLSGEEARQQELERQRQLAARKAEEDKAKAEEERLKNAPRISYKWGENPFQCTGGGLNYDHPCTGYIFFMDIVKYSAKPTAEQKRVIDELSSMVKATKQFKSADRAGKLVALPTGDGMVLGFFTNVLDAFLCALDVAKRVYKHPSIGLRMGVHYGPCVPIRDINDNPNISGDGINMAQRVMDAGDNDHLLISNIVHSHIAARSGLQFEDFGQVYVKHGVAMHLWSVYGKNFGRREFPHWRVKKA